MAQARISRTGMDRACSAYRQVWTGAALIAAAAALAGCAAIAPLAEQAKSGVQDLVEASNLTPLGVNPASPIAADAERAEQVNGPIPSFAGVPPRPGDVRPPAAYKTEVLAVVGDKRALNRWANANPPGVDDAKATEAYAEAQRRRVGNEAPVAATKQGETEAFVRKGRQAVGQSDQPPQPTH